MGHFFSTFYMHLLANILQNVKFLTVYADDTQIYITVSQCRYLNGGGGQWPIYKADIMLLNLLNLIKHSN